MSDQMSPKANKRIKEVVTRKLVILAGAVLVGVLYFVWIKMTGIAIPCVVQRVTGWKCPGCGITTLFYCLFQLRIQDAFWANPFLFVTMPFLIYESIREGLFGPTNSRWNNGFLIGYLILLIAFGVFRNLYGI